MKNRHVKYWLEHKSSLLTDYEKRLQSYDSILEAMIKQLEGLINAGGVKGLIKGRVKNFEAFYRKLIIKCQNNQVDDPFDFIQDIIGLRVVVPFIEDIKSMESLIRDHFEIIEVQYKWQELSIKEFGYDSVHFMVEIPDDVTEGDALICEIQLRTILQEAWAEVEHELVYKTSLDNVEDSIKRKLIAIKATLSLADTTFQEIRDYQRKRFHDLEERHRQLIDKVSTLHEKSVQTHPEGKGKRESFGAENTGTDSEMNDLYFEALNAHLDNKLDKALDLYTHLIMIAPNHYLYNHRGLVYFTLGQYDKSVSDFSAAIAIEPGDTRVYTNRGLAYRMLKKYHEALADFNKSIEINPLWPDTYYGRALAYFDIGNIRLAVDDCDKAITLNAQFKQAVRFKQFLLNQQFE